MTNGVCWILVLVVDHDFAAIVSVRRRRQRRRSLWLIGGGGCEECKGRETEWWFVNKRARGGKQARGGSVGVCVCVRARRSYLPRCSSRPNH